MEKSIRNQVSEIQDPGFKPEKWKKEKKLKKKFLLNICFDNDKD